MAKVKISSRVKHNGEYFNDGDVIDNLTDQQAQALIDSDVAVKAKAGDKPSTGTKVENSSSIKQNLLGKDMSNRKTVTQKAQERNEKASKAAADKAKKDADDAAKNVPPAPDDSTDDDQEPPKEPTTPPAGNEGDDAVELPSEFKNGDDEYGTKADKNGKVNGYLKNGETIKKIDYLEAQQSHVPESSN